MEESDVPHIAMIGDFNANKQTDANTLFGKELKRFCREELMSISECIFCPSNSFTFYSVAHQSVFWLDHCFRFQVKSLPSSEMLIGCVREWRKRNKQEIVSEERRR